MKTTIALLAALTLCGCTVTEIQSDTWTMRRRSFLQRMDIAEVTVGTNGMATLRGYKNDGGNEALGVAVGAAVAAAVKAAKP